MNRLHSFLLVGPTILAFMIFWSGGVQAQESLPTVVRTGSNLESDADHILERYVENSLEDLGIVVLDDEPSQESDTDAWFIVNMKSFEVDRYQSGETFYDIVAVATLAYEDAGRVFRSLSSFFYQVHNASDLKDVGQNIAEDAVDYQVQLLEAIAAADTISD